MAADIAYQLNASWVVVDGYHFDAEYQGIIKKSGLSLLFIDDTGHADHYSADLVLNQNAHAHEDLYKNRESYTRLLLDTEYTLLRREFLSWAAWKREIPTQVKRLLITLGGGDPENVTTKIVESIQLMDTQELELTVIVGGSNPHQKAVKEALDRLSCDTQILKNTKEMPRLMAWEDIAITGGGSTCWESAFMGLPSAVFVLADNQSDIATGLHAAGVVLNLGPHKDVDLKGIATELKALMENQKWRKEMSLMGKRLVDGQGSMRVLKALVPDVKNNGAGGLP